MTSGHIKLVKGAEDSDPSEYLLPSIDMKRKDGKKPKCLVAVAHQKSLLKLIVHQYPCHGLW